MNILNTIESIHFRSNRSLDLTMISNHNREKLSQTLVYIYNYEGIHYRIFATLTDYLNFLNNMGDNCICEFDSETKMENYLTLEFEIT